MVFFANGRISWLDLWMGWDGWNVFFFFFFLIFLIRFGKLRLKIIRCGESLFILPLPSSLPLSLIEANFFKFLVLFRYPVIFMDYPSSLWPYTISVGNADSAATDRSTGSLKQLVGTVGAV